VTLWNRGKYTRNCLLRGKTSGDHWDLGVGTGKGFTDSLHEKG